MTIPLRTFVLKSTPTFTGYPIKAPIMRDVECKHVKMTYDGLRRRSICGGGDIGGNSAGARGMLFDYATRTNTWTTTSPECSGPGRITLHASHIDDTRGLTVDLKRNRYLSFGGSTAVSGSPGGQCTPLQPGQPTGGTWSFGVLAQDPSTRDWSVVVNGIPYLSRASPQGLLRSGCQFIGTR